MYKKVRVAVLLACAMVASVATSALAILPADQQAAVDSITTNVTDLISAGWAILITMATAVIGMKIFKKLFSKATG